MKTSIIVTTLMILHGWFPGTTQCLLYGHTSDGIKVMRLLCESEKYLWIGTNAGLVRRSVQTGKEWVVSKESSILRSNEITCGVCLPDGRAYIGTKDELLYWDNHILIQITNLNSDLPENNIRELMVDQQENVWVKTIHGQVGKVYESNVKMLKTGKHIPASVNVMCRSRAIPSKFATDSMAIDSTQFNR